jgi:intracellular multiplication protein IcmE
MSGTAIRRRFRGPFNKAGTAGPMRFVVIGGIGLVVVGTVVAATLAGDDPLPESRVARQASVNPLPGGTNSTPYQSRLAVAENQRQAEQAQSQGRSYTPPINASQRATDVAALLQPPAPPATVVVGPPAPLPTQAVQARATTAVPLVSFEAPAPPTRVQPAVAPAPQQNPIRTVAQTTTQQQPVDDPAFREALARMMGSWQGRPGRTTVTLTPPSSASAAEGDDGRRGTGGPPPLARQVSSGEVSPAGATASLPPRSASAPQGRVLVPAGRGIYAHTVLAVNSESGGPIVLQADTGPIAGARLIGTFSKPGTISRLVVRINSVQFQGQEIAAEGLVIAPDTMETAVASSVDQRLGERFLLPAAAAFVAGLGQAVATTSNTFGQVSPFGGQSYITRLNPEQQLAVGAGAAAQQVGRALEQSAPRGPLVHLAANAPVGVMFLSNLTAPN